MTNTFYDRNPLQAWEEVFSGVDSLGIRRFSSNSGIKYINNEFDDFGGFLYNQNKNYQFTTKVSGSSPPLLSIKLSAPFTAGIVTVTRNISTIGGVLFYTYANPINTEYSNDIIKYGADQSFSGSYIESSNINEIDFLINGYREFTYLDIPIDYFTQPNGWCYDTSTGFGKYNWYFSSSSNTIEPTYSIFGSGLEAISPNNPYIATLIDYDYFNLDFSFSFTGGSTDDSIQVFLANQSDLKLGTASWELINFNGITSLNTNGTYSKINLAATNIDGTRRYLVFSPSMVGTRTTTYTASLSIISIVGGYNPLNNLQVLPATSSTTNNIDVVIPESIYTYDSVTNGVTYSLSSKVGNGHFKAGIWENGVWNNGWRDDTEVKDFDDVYSAILYAYDISWKIKISGSKASCDSFKVGDKVSIGNIVAIDINENRKLIRDYYTISATGSDGIGSSMINWIEVSLDTTFPYRRIERDSPNHKIKVTKNIWLSGAFFNGYFSGVWNNGLFKGYPKITEMFDTHWIDGFFNGGHFNSNYPNYYFSDVSETTDCNYNNVTLVFGTISTSDFINGEPDDYTPGHNLLPGDYITIDKDPTQYIDTITNLLVIKVLNPEYNGICRVMSVSGNNVVVNKKHLINLQSAEIGKVIRYTASSVIQNFKFYDTNKSLLKSNESSISASIFSFNSWIDTNYDTTRSVTLGRDFRSYEPLTGKSFNRNNLYGYPTYDVLSSASRFRNSFNLDYGLYKLGTKYKLFNDFIGDASGFNEPFNPAEPTISNFYNDGWAFSTKNITDLAFNRSEAVISTNNASIFSTSIQDYIDSGVTGNELYLTATYSGAVLNNDRITTNKSRYTIVEFDVVTYSIADSKFTYTNQNTYEILTSGPGSVFGPPATQSNSSSNTGNATASNIFSFNSVQNLGVTSIATQGSYNFEEGFDGEVWSVDRQSTGDIIVSGNFKKYNGSDTPMPKLCRIKDDGTLDTTFNPVINDINDSNIKFIKVLVVKNFSALNDKIFVLINYNSSVTVNGKSSVLGRTIRLEPTGVPTSTLGYQKEFNGFITDFAVRQTDGYLIVIGNFTAIYYSTTLTYWLNKIAMFSNTGSFTGNNLASSTNDQTTGFYEPADIPSTIVTLSDGTFIVGGKIRKFKTSTDNTYMLNGIVKLNTPSDGKITVNTTLVSVVLLSWSVSSSNKGFSYPTSAPSTLPNSSINFINKIEVDNSNRIYVIGNFSSYNDGSARTCYNIARLNSNGSFDTSFNTGQGLNSSAYDMKFNSYFSSLSMSIVFDFTKIFIGGQFTKYNGQDCGKVISIGDSGVLDSTINDLNPSNSIVRTLTTTGNSLVAGGTFSSYQLGTTITTIKTIVTSEYTQSESISSSDILGLAVKINLDCTGTDLSNITINLKSPEGKIINVKDGNVGNGTKLTDTIFDILSTTSLSTGTTPYSSGTFSMSLQPNKGTTIFGLSNVTTLNELIPTNENAQGTWTIYIQNDNNITNNIYPILNSWALIVKYKKSTSDTAIEITPSVDLPILHFNNLNYEIGSQPNAGGQSDLIYRRMSYLPITQNINHLLVQNSFRFDSVEKTSAERYNGFGTNTIKKKYEYFYNKTDLMMSIQGNGEMGGSQSMLVLDNIKMYETDMIPFFKYFEDANIYKGIQVPYEGVAPNIDYLNSDFVFVDNITLGLDSINNTIIDNNFVCVPNVFIIASSSVIVTTATSSPSSISATAPLTAWTSQSAIVSGYIAYQGVIAQGCGVLVGTSDPLVVGGSGNITPFTSGIYGTISGPVSGLLPNTTYNVRAYVITQEVYSTGGLSPYIYSYGGTTSFTTLAIPPDYNVIDYSPTDYSH